MKIATSTNILHARTGNEPIPIETCIRACAKAGFRELDFGFVEHANVSASFHTDAWREEILEYKALAESLDMKFVQAHGTILDFCNPDSSDEEGLLLLHRSIQGAALLGAPHIVVHPSTGVEGARMRLSTHEENVAFFRRLGEYANAQGIGIALENMWGNTREGVPRFAVQPEELLRLVEDVGLANVGACWDTEHGSIERIDQGAAIRLLGKHLRATHISDEKGRDNVHVLPITGFVDWEDVLKALGEIGYPGPFVYEMQHYLLSMPMELVPSALRLSVEVGEHLIDRLEAYRTGARSS